MAITINVDIGGTFTDVLIFRDGQRATGKADTTVYNLTVGFMSAVERAAAELELSLAEALGLKAGDNLDLIIQGPAGPTHVAFNILAVYDTKFGEYDKSFVFVSLEEAQRLLFKGATNVAVLLYKPEEAPQLAQTIESWSQAAKIDTP